MSLINNITHEDGFKSKIKPKPISLKPMSLKPMSLKPMSLKPILNKIRTLKRRVVDKFHLKPLTMSRKSPSNSKSGVSSVKKSISKENMESFLNKVIVENNNDDKKLFVSLKKIKNVSMKRNELDFLDETKKNIHYLNSICTNSGECLIFGLESNRIKDLFNGFSDFTYLTGVKKVGEKSSNGFVLNLQYERMDYKVNALLKSSKRKRSDNLYYEYLVGTKFINRINLFLPCFTETYRLLKHRTKDTKMEIEDDNVHASEFSNFIDVNICDERKIRNSLICIENSCKNGINFAILLQYINEPISIYSFAKKHENDDLFESQMIAILIQIYGPLSYLKEEFTHYDLHSKNVMLYKLPEGKFVEIKYFDERDGSTISIQTSYIAKIIDYGRCYFGNLGNSNYMTSKMLGKIIRQTKECNQDNVGYNFFEDFQDEENFYISSCNKNISHDLRLAHLLSNSSRKMHLLFDGLIEYESNYGTPQKLSSSRDYIRNVSDMYDFLKVSSELMEPSVDEKDKSIGCIDVFMTVKLCNKKMDFVSIK